MKLRRGTLLNWFYANNTVANPDHFQLMFLGIPEKHEGDIISSTEYVKGLGIEIDNQIRFRGM